MVLSGFLKVFFFKFYFGCHDFYLKKLKIIRYNFELARGRKFGVEQ